MKELAGHADVAITTIYRQALDNGAAVTRSMLAPRHSWAYRQARMQAEAEQAERDRTREIVNKEMDRLAAERRRRKPT